MMPWPREGVPIVLSAPSGAGKTTLCHKLMQNFADIRFSVSSTTRTPRLHERHGHDYDFVDDSAFDTLVQANAFLEWAHVHGRRYGTRRDFVEQALARGEDVLFDIDVQGAQQLKQALPDAVLIYILPPSLSALAERLRMRSSESDKDRQGRLAAATRELAAARGYTHWIINDILDDAYADLSAIVRAERLRRLRREVALERIIGEPP